MRARRHIACLLTAAAVVLTACGGGDEGASDTGSPTREGDRKGAENAVRGYLRALAEKDGPRACSHFTPEYQRSVVQKNEEFARKSGADTCGELIDAITKAAGRATFEGAPLNPSTVDKLKLEVTVREGGEEQNATVTGAQGLQRYQLHTTNGKWLIAEVESAGG